MASKMILRRFLSSKKKASTNIFSTDQKNGYWSNLSKKQNEELMNLIKKEPVQECIRKTNPALLDVIFSAKRGAGIELLKLEGKETVVDLGCMWGALSIPLARQANFVLGVDQTIESLKFSEARAKEEKLKNIQFLCGNLRDIQLPPDSVDVAVVNGVLEWIPELEPVVVDDYWYQAKQRKDEGNPGEMQKDFLRNIHTSLCDKGRLYLAIENRYDYKMFSGIKDPHSGLFFTTVLPRFLANLISRIFRKRSYRPWIYSFRELEELLKKTGYKNIKLHACWPDYRFPDYLNVYGERNPAFQPMSARKNGKIGFRKLIANRLEWLLFKKLNLQFFAPSIIAIAEK